MQQNESSVLVDKESGRIKRFLNTHIGNSGKDSHWRESIEPGENERMIYESEVDFDFKIAEVGEKIEDSKLVKDDLKEKYIYWLAEFSEFREKKIRSGGKVAVVFEKPLSEKEEKELEERTGKKIFRKEDNLDTIEKIRNSEWTAGDAIMSDERKKFLESLKTEDFRSRIIKEEVR